MATFQRTPRTNRIPLGLRVCLAVGSTRDALAGKLRERLAQAGHDRGEGPVSTAIMVALIAAVAVLVGGVILAVATAWTGKIPKP